MPYSARTCGGGGPGGGPGGFFPGGKRGTPGTVAKIGPEDADRGPLLRDTQKQNSLKKELPQWHSTTQQHHIPSLPTETSNAVYTG